MLPAVLATRSDGSAAVPPVRPGRTVRSASPLAVAGRGVAFAADRVHLTVNAVAMLAAAATSFGVVLLAAAPASFAIGAGVAILLGLGLVLDAAVAPLARLTQRPVGLRLGRIATAIALHAGVFVSAFRSLVPTELPGLLILPPAFAFVAIALAVVAVMNDRRRRTASVVALPSRRSPLLTVLSDGSALALAFLLLGAAPVFLATYALLFATSLAALVLSVVAAIRVHVR